MNYVNVDLLQPRDVSETATLIACAMCTNPINIAVFKGQDDDRRLRQEAMFKFILEHFPGQALVARQAGRIVGVLRMVEWPHCQMSPEEGRKLEPLMDKVLKDVTPRVLEWRSTWAQHDPQEAHWHLGPVAVVPEMQGQGVGSRMLERTCERVDSLGGAIYLETDKPGNVRFYERFGFSVIGEVEIYGVNCWFMWRAPQR